MFEGRSLVSYYEIAHILKKDYNISFTEYNMMLPYGLEAELMLIRRDLQEEKEHKQRQLSQGF